MDINTYKPVKHFEELDQYLYPSLAFGTQAIFSKTEQLILVPSNYGNIAIFETSNPEIMYAREHPLMEATEKPKSIPQFCHV
jgi:hypothetical protein